MRPEAVGSWTQPVWLHHVCHLAVKERESSPIVPRTTATPVPMDSLRTARQTPSRKKCVHLYHNKPALTCDAVPRRQVRPAPPPPPAQSGKSPDRPRYTTRPTWVQLHWEAAGRGGAEASQSLRDESKHAAAGERDSLTEALAEALVMAGRIRLALAAVMALGLAAAIWKARRRMEHAFMARGSVSWKPGQNPIHKIARLQWYCVPYASPEQILLPLARHLEEPVPARNLSSGAPLEGPSWKVGARGPRHW